MEPLDVSVVIPAYNEEKAIGPVLDDIRRVMDAARDATGRPYRYEIIVVDDASTDQTAEICRARNVEVIRHADNVGSGGSRKTGIDRARGGIVVMTDADGTYPAEAIPYLLAKFPEYDQVVGARQSEKGTLRPLRSLAKASIKAMASYLVGKPIPDLNSGLRAFKKEIMQRYTYLMPDGFSCVSTMSLAFLANKHRVGYVPIAYFPRVGKSKFHPVRDTYRYILTVIRVVSYFNPLHVFIPAAMLLIGFGILKSIFDFFWTRTVQESDIIAILAGFIIGAIGILADLIILQGKKGHGGGR
jgi:glycosyltransferase involved in cell wall biosynthesis